jgi:hypothetical protein
MSAFHSQLIQQAHHLATREPRRPIQASVRRSVSASYYAVFHCLNAEFTNLFPAGSLELTCRQLDHTPAKSVATETKKGGVRSTPDCLFGSIVTQDLYDVCGNFVLLQQMRHDADYDLARKFRREEAIDCYNRAVKTIKAIDKLKKTEPLLLQSFVLALVFNPKVRKR